MGLSRIIIYSAISGVLFGFFYRVSSEQASNIRLPTLDFLSKNLDPRSQALVLIISLFIAIYSVYRLGKFFSQVLEQKLAGILSAALGFFGAFLMVLGIENNSHVFVIGIGVLAIGAMFTIFYKKNNKLGKSS